MKISHTKAPLPLFGLPLLGLCLLLASFGAALPGCGGGGGDSDAGEVVLYASLDEAYSRPLMDLFTRKTGVRVLFNTDSEATKTTGLVSRIINERARPRCDVFWNNEIVQTIHLKKNDCLVPFKVVNQMDIPATWQDPEGYWVGFAARARVIILNTGKVKEPYPQSLTSLTDPKFKGQGAFARPLNGTTATHAAVLWARWGAERTQQFFETLEKNEVRRCAGNAHVMREVSAGNMPWGFTDTDDFHVALLDKKPVDIVFPDGDGEGTLLIPNTVCMVKGGPNPENARKLINFILSREVETILAKGRSAQIPVREGIPQPTGLKGLDKMKVMEVDWTKVGDVFEASHTWLKDFVRGK